MATHTTTSNTFPGRTFAISRENGQQDKNGRPFWFEWLSELPAEKGKRKFETRTGASGPRHYELFAAIDGILTDITTEEKSFGETKAPETWLILYLDDDGEQYKLDIGALDSRYSMDIMKRLLDPAFNPDLKLRLSPYSMEKDNGGYNIGLSAYSGPDGKLSASYQDDHLKGMPQPTTSEYKGKTLWDFSKVAEWLYRQVMDQVSDKVGASVAPIQTNITANHDNVFSADFPQEAPPVESDDLPF